MMMPLRNDAMRVYEILTNYRDSILTDYVVVGGLDGAYEIRCGIQIQAGARAERRWMTVLLCGTGR